MKIVATSLMLLALWTPELRGHAPVPLQGADLEGLLGEADALLARQRFEEALKAYKQADKMAGGSCDRCRLGVIKTFSRMGANKNAAREAEKLVESTSDIVYKVQAYNELGVAKLSMGKEKDLRVAEEAFRQVLALSEGETIMAYYNLAHVLYGLGRDDEAAEQLKEYLNWDPDSVTAERAMAILENPRRATEPFAPDFSLVTVDGEYLSLEDLEGNVILLDFWATWCAPCKAALPDMRRLGKKMEKDPFVLISVSSEDRATVEPFIEQERMNWHQYVDERGQLGRALFQVRVLPTYILIDHEGVIQYRTTGWSPSKNRDIAGKVSKAIKNAKKAAQ